MRCTRDRRTRTVHAVYFFRRPSVVTYVLNALGGWTLVRSPLVKSATSTLLLVHSERGIKSQYQLFVNVVSPRLAKDCGSNFTSVGACAPGAARPGHSSRALVYAWDYKGALHVSCAPRVAAAAAPAAAVKAAATRLGV